MGAWRFTDLGFDLPSLATMTEDGNLLLSNLPVEPVPAEMDARMLLLTSGHGVWEAAGEDRATFTFVYLYADETGAFQSAATLSGMLKLADDGQALRGEYGSRCASPRGRRCMRSPGPSRGRASASFPWPRSPWRLPQSGSAPCCSRLLAADLIDLAVGGSERGGFIQRILERQGAAFSPGHGEDLDAQYVAQGAEVSLIALAFRERRERRADGPAQRVFGAGQTRGQLRLPRDHRDPRQPAQAFREESPIPEPPA